MSDAVELVGDNGPVTDQAAEPAPTDAPAAEPPRRAGLLVALAALILAVDVVSKVVVVATLEDREPVRLLGGSLYLVLYRNSGAAFSLASGMTWLLTLIVMAVIVVLIRLATKLRSAGWAVALGLVLGGALGNLVDRLFRAPGPMRGHVVDFVSVFASDGSVWPVFNVADSAISVGGVLLVLLALLGRDFNGQRTRDRRRGEE